MLCITSPNRDTSDPKTAGVVRCIRPKYVHQGNGIGPKYVHQGDGIGSTLRGLQLHLHPHAPIPQNHPQL